MRITRWGVVTVLIAALAGCETTTTPPPAMTASFDAASLAFIHSRGTASIEGQAFARQAGGGVVTAAGEEILLIPATDFTRQVTDRMMQHIPVEAETAQIKPFKRTTIADADGRFKFADLAPGSYLVLATVLWQAGDYGTQGGPLKTEVTVTAGEHASIIMAR